MASSTLAAVQARGATAAGRPSNSTFSGREPASVRWSASHPGPGQCEGQQTGRGGPADPVITPGGARRDAAATTGQLGAQGGQQPRPDDPTATGGGEEGACRVCAAAAAITLVLVGTESRGQ